MLFEFLILFEWKKKKNFSTEISLTLIESNFLIK